MPEDYQPTLPQDDEEAPPVRNELTFFHGIIYLEEGDTPKNNKWIFESYKQCFQA
jgi:hypothetical protein